MTIDPTWFPDFLPEQIADPVFRLTCGKIYKIRDKNGHLQYFKPNAAQKRIIRLIWHDKKKFILIPKSRQRGISTLMSLIVLDMLLWSENVQTTLIDFNGNNAKKKMVEKVVLAFENLDEPFKTVFAIVNQNRQTGELCLGINPLMGEFGTSTGFFGDQPRGGTNQLLWLSEWAEIAARFPRRSEDIKTGALPSAETGIVIIETTWHGGKRGDVWPFVKEATETPEQFRTPRTAHLEFFAWWGDPDNAEEGSPESLRPDTLAYFKDIRQAWPNELKDVEFSTAQMIWYQRTSDRQGIHMRGQHPTVLAECFESPVRGAIWAEAIAAARQEGRITTVPHDITLDVDTFWDLGAPSNTAIKFVQHLGGMHHIIASMQGGWTELPDLVRKLKATGYIYRYHFLPHDGAQTARTGVTFEQAFRDEIARQDCSGKIIVLPRSGDVWVGINHMTGIFRSCLIERTCKDFIEAAEAYRKKSDPQDDERFLDLVEKDWTSHECDSVRYLAEADLLGYLPGTGNAVAERPYFDPDATKAAGIVAASNPPRPFSLSCSDKPNQPIRFVNAFPDPAGWLRIWNSAQEGKKYIVTLIARSLQVWSADDIDGPLMLQAAPPFMQRPDHALLYVWAAQLSAFYGLAPIAVDVISHPGAVAELRRLGACVLNRMQRDGRRPLGQETPTQHAGWEWTPEVQKHAFVLLQDRLRKSRIEPHCPSLVNQLHEFQNGTDGYPEYRDGVAVDLVFGAALACLCHDHATQFRNSTPVGYNDTGAVGGGPSRMKKR